MAQNVYCLKIIRRPDSPYTGNTEELIIGVYSDKEHAIGAAETYIRKHIPGSVFRNFNFDKLFDGGMDLPVSIGFCYWRYNIVAMDVELDKIYN